MTPTTAEKSVRQMERRSTAHPHDTTDSAGPHLSLSLDLLRVAFDRAFPDGDFAFPSDDPLS
jgi:hypothetical protein